MLLRKVKSSSKVRESDGQWEKCKPRFRLALRREGVTQRALADALTPPVHRNTLNRWLKAGVTEAPSFLQFMQIGLILQCSGRWIAGLTDDPTPPAYLSNDERAMLDIYRAMNPNERAALLAAARESKELGERV
jgi:hypothetical protein